MENSFKNSLRRKTNFTANQYCSLWQLISSPWLRESAVSNWCMHYHNEDQRQGHYFEDEIGINLGEECFPWCGVRYTVERQSIFKYHCN